MRQSLLPVVAILLCLTIDRVRAAEPSEIKVTDTDDTIQIETDALQARIRKKGYVSGIEKNTFLDKKTGAHDAGFGVHIMDFLLAPGWKEDGYERNPKL